MNNKIKIIIGSIFYVTVTILLIRIPIPNTGKVPAPLIWSLLSGTDKGYIEIGSEFKPFKKLLPKDEKAFSFIMDYPFSPYGAKIEDLYTAQSYFVPQLINPVPTEKISIIYCSNKNIADKRMKETNYKLAFPIKNGKGLAIKNL